MATGEITKNTKGLLYLTVLIYPLWSFYLSFKYFRMPQAKNLFWLFCIFLGMVHIYFPEGESSSDGVRYAQQLIDLHQQPVPFENFTSLFYEDGQFVDIYQPIVTYLLSTVTDNPRWLFLIFAVVFGFFYSRNSWFVLERFPKTVAFPLFLLSFYYILICPVWEINGVRTWTALHVFVYGALPYLYNSDKSKLIWCGASCLFHFSFFLPVTVLLMYHFIPKSINYLLAFFLISLFIKEIDLEQIRSFILTYAPSFIHNRADMYANEDYAQTINDLKSNLNFYMEGSKMFVQWVAAILLFVSGVWGKKIVETNRSLKNLLCFSLFIYAISNILSLIPSFGRFIVLSQSFAFASLIFFYISYKQSQFINKTIAVSFKMIPLLLFLPIIVKLRFGSDFYGISLLFNPIAALFVDDNQPFIHYIKSIF